jgi:hypothetical protein
MQMDAQRTAEADYHGGVAKAPIHPFERRAIGH